MNFVLGCGELTSQDSGKLLSVTYYNAVIVTETWCYGPPYSCSKRWQVSRTGVVNYTMGASPSSRTQRRAVYDSLRTCSVHGPAVAAGAAAAASVVVFYRSIYSAPAAEFISDRSSISTTTSRSLSQLYIQIQPASFSRLLLLLVDKLQMIRNSG